MVCGYVRWRFMKKLVNINQLKCVFFLGSLVFYELHLHVFLSLKCLNDDIIGLS